MYVLSTTTGSLLRKNLFSKTSKLITVPPFLVLLAPKHSHNERSFCYIVPDQQITFDNSILQLICRSCYSTNNQFQVSDDFYTCHRCNEIECLSESQLITPYLCGKCLSLFHNKLSRRSLREHNAKRITVGKEKMNLFAVICAENSEHTAFVKCHRKDGGHQWLAFEYILDDENEDEDIIVPCISLVHNFDDWLIAAENNPKFFERMERTLKQNKQETSSLDEDFRRKVRVFRRGILYFYERSNNDWR